MNGVNTQLILDIIKSAIYVIISVFALIVTVSTAKKRGRNTALWGILAFFTGWIAAIIVYFLPDISTDDEEPVTKPPVSSENAYTNFDPNELGGYSLNKNVNKFINKAKTVAEDNTPWNCPICNYKNLGKASHCFNCGYGKDGSWICQNCGNKNIETNKYCSNCGNKKPE